MAADLSASHPEAPVWHRLPRLWALHARMDLQWVMRDVKMFLMWTFADSVMTVAGVTAMWLLSERFGGIGHWTRPQVLFLLGYGAVVTGIVDTFFGYNVAYVSRRLGRGQLDHTLIMPQPICVSLLTEGFVPFSGSAILMPGVALLAWATHRLHLVTGPGWLAMLALDLGSSVLVLLAFQYGWGSLAFWAPRAAEEISSSTMQLMTQLVKYPLDGLSIGLTGGLLSVLPVGFLAWYPCRVLLGQAGGREWVTPAAALMFALFAGWAWREGMRHYGRVGSQRYSGRGFRS